MKIVKIAYWIVTILFGGFMAFSGVQNAINGPDSQQLMHTALGYPMYIIPFIGVAKVLGAAGILIPGFPRIKEWAYAGLMFDLFGATFSFFALGGEMMGGIAFMAIFIVLGFAS